VYIVGNTPQHTPRNPLSTLHHAATYCKTFRHTKPHCTTHYHTLQHTLQHTLDVHRWYLYDTTIWCVDKRCISRMYISTSRGKMDVKYIIFTYISLICKRSICMCDVRHHGVFEGYDAVTCVTWHIHTCDLHMCDMTHLCVYHDEIIRKTCAKTSWLFGVLMREIWLETWLKCIKNRPDKRDLLCMNKNLKYLAQHWKRPMYIKRNLKCLNTRARKRADVLCFLPSSNMEQLAPK